MSRNTPLLIAVASVLLARPALALGVTAALPQTGSGGTATSVTTTTRRCASCATPAERRAHTKLLLKIDSIRSEIENRRMTDAERELAAAELLATVRELQRSLGELPGYEAAVVARAAQGQQPAPPPAVAVAGAAPYMTLRNPTRGYLGVTFDAVTTAESMSPTEHRIRFFSYPRIALVEPSSPAERAGVLRGDTVLAFNGTDVTSEVISFTKLLVPDAKIVMRVRRDGSAKDLKVTVGEAPDYYARRREVGGFVGRVSPAPSPATVASRASEAPVGEPSRVVVTPLPRQQPGASGFRYWVDYEGLAGASLETIEEGLAKALNVESGVLVVRSAPGTPAYRSGLRGGDVIIKAAGNSIRGVAGLRRVLSEGDGTEGVKLVILRERKERDLTLRWER